MKYLPRLPRIQHCWDCKVGVRASKLVHIRGQIVKESTNADPHTSARQSAVFGFER